MSGLSRCQGQRLSEISLRFATMNHDNLRLNSTHNPENSHRNMMRFQMHFSLDENERKRSLNLSEKVVLRTSETSTIEQP